MDAVLVAAVQLNFRMLSLWLSRLLELVTVNSGRRVCRRGASQSVAALCTELDVHPTRSDIDSASVRRLEVSRGATKRLLRKRKTSLDPIDLLFLALGVFSKVGLEAYMLASQSVDEKHLFTFIAETSESFSTSPPWAFDSFDSALRRSSSVIWKVLSVILNALQGVDEVRYVIQDCNNDLSCQSIGQDRSFFNFFSLLTFAASHASYHTLWAC